ncbi:MAG TPA: Mur ligase family protein, partial [Luteolibacter sp.]|nr:Mur ligase family protein [Luteolibacter sp.]
NHIGVPLTVLSAEPDPGAAVWEMGINHSGEIAPLCEIARPRYGIITNIGTAHIEFLGSRDAIAEEKGALARALPEDGILFLPATCDYHSYLRQRTRASIVSVGNGRGAVRAEQPVFEAERTIFQLVIDGAGSVEIELPVAGRHMVTNALLAAATGWKLGVPLEQIAAGLADVKLTSGRLRRYRSGEVEIIDDTYNANPESMIAAIDTLAELPVSGRRFIVLGRMGELGKYAAEGHLKVGRHAKARGLRLLAVGEGAQGIAEGGGAPHLESFDQAAGWLRTEVRPGDVVLFKGSRLAAVDTLMNSVFPQS